MCCQTTDQQNTIQAELIEITENLHRNDLTASERDEHIAVWIRLTDKNRTRAFSLQNETKRGRPESGVRAAARELGVESVEAHRATKVASLSDDAKRVAREVGLDDNRSALQEAAKQHEPAKQADTLRKIHDAGNVTASKAKC